MYEKYKNKRVIIKSTEVEGTIVNVIPRHNQENKLAVRYQVLDDEGKTHQLMPHEVQIKEEPPMMGTSY